MGKWILFLVVLLAGCASTQRGSGPRAPILQSILKGPSEYTVLGTGSDDPQALCKGFRLTNKQVGRYFDQAVEVAPPTESMEGDLFSCYVRGIAENSGKKYPWTVRVDGRGQMKVSPKTTIWFSCPACAERFTGH